MDEHQQQLLAQFISLTGDDRRAQFFLTSTDWNLDTAVQLFYDCYESREEEVDHQDLNLASEEPDSEEVMAESDQPGGAAKKDNNNNRNSDRPNIATLASLGQDDQSDRQAFYAGGSEHSGQQILGSASLKKGDSNKIISNLFKQARENAEHEEEDEDSSAMPTARPAFVGTGFTLGSTPNDSVSISSSRAGPAIARPGAEQDIERILKMWQNGFSIDDGPLRAYNDPANLEFMTCIGRGEIPPELRNGNAEVRLAMQDHRHEEYVAPKVAKKPFAGEGHRLGAPTGQSVVSDIAAVKDESIPLEQRQTEADKFVALNEAEPHTRIQIQLADGSRLVVKINLSRLISDLRHYICILRPEFAILTFHLMTRFPNKVLDNENLSIQEAGLANSCIVQQMN